MYVQLENNIPVKWPVSEQEVRAAYPDQSLPQFIPNDLALELGYGAFVFNGYPPEYDPQWQNIEEVTPVLVDGVYQQTYQITEKYSPEEKKKLQDEQAMQNNKQLAQMYLQQTDWTTIPDVGNPNISNPYLANVAEFISYRNAIRQIAINPPVIVNPWPTKPNEVWSS